MESLENIRLLATSAIAKGLHGAESLITLDLCAIQDAYNGIGPESLPAEIREKVSRYLAAFAPAAVIHDVRYEFSDGEQHAFDYANMEFFVNCMKLARDRFAWYDPRRYLAQEAAWLMYRAVSSESGWQSWLEAKEKHETKKLVSQIKM